MKLASLFASVAIITSPALTLGAITSAAWPALSQEQTPPAAPPQIADERPAAEILPKLKTLSLLITSCNYSIVEIGDPYFGVDRMAILRDQIGRDASALSGKVVRVKKYVAYINARNATRGRVNRDVGGGVVGGIMAGINNQCPKEKTTGGWYDVSETTTPYSPYVVEILAEIDGKPYAVHSVYSPDIEIFLTKKQMDANRANYEKSLAKANAALIAAVGTPGI